MASATRARRRPRCVPLAQHLRFPSRPRPRSPRRLALLTPCQSGGETPPSCNYLEADFCLPSDESTNEGAYVDLSLNPERFTGYAGESAARVWEAIYRENCFGQSETAGGAAAGRLGSSAGVGAVLGGAGAFGGAAPGGGGWIGSLAPEGRKAEMEEEECLEKKVYYRVISGASAPPSPLLSIALIGRR